MDCAKVKENLPFFGDGSLDPTTEQEMDRHIAHCPDCTKAYEAQKQVLKMVAVAYGEFAPAPAIDLTASIRKGITFHKRERGLVKYLTPVAAAAVIIISVFIHGYNATQPGNIPNVADIDDETYYAYIGEYFVSSYDYLTNTGYLSDYFNSDEYNNIDAEILLDSGYVNPSTADILGSLNDEEIDILFAQMRN